MILIFFFFQRKSYSSKINKKNHVLNVFFIVFSQVLIGIVKNIYGFYGEGRPLKKKKNSCFFLRAPPPHPHNPYIFFTIPIRTCEKTMKRRLKHDFIISFGLIPPTLKKNKKKKSSFLPCKLQNFC